MIKISNIFSWIFHSRQIVLFFKILVSLEYKPEKVIWSEFLQKNIGYHSQTILRRLHGFYLVIYQFILL